MAPAQPPAQLRRLTGAQNIQIRTLPALLSPGPPTARNGGSARGYQELPHRWRSPTAEQAAARPVCLCIASAGRYRPVMPPWACFLMNVAGAGAR